MTDNTIKCETAKCETVRPSPSDLLLENQLCFAVYSAAHAFSQAYKQHLEPLGLTYPQYLVMLLLWEEDGRTVGELGAPLYLDSGTLTPLLKRMEKTGFIIRRRDDQDERKQRIYLSDMGKAIKDAAMTIPSSMLCATGVELDEVRNLRERIRQLDCSLRLAAGKSSAA